MKAFFESKAGAKFNAILWTVITAIWLALCVGRIAEGTEEGLIVITAITTLLSAFNSALQWIRWKNWNEKTDVKE